MKRSEFLNKFRPTLEQAPMPPASLDPYSGPWTRTQVTHLLRRTQFGLHKKDVDAFLALGVNGAVGKILDVFKDAIPATPLNIPIRVIRWSLRRKAMGNMSVLSSRTMDRVSLNRIFPSCLISITAPRKPARAKRRAWDWDYLL